MKRSVNNPPYATKADVKEIVTEAFDSFAQIMKRSFDDVYGRFDAADIRMDGLVTKDEFQPFKRETEQSLYELKTDVGHIKNRLDRVETRLDGMDTRFETVDAKFDFMNEKFDSMDQRFNSMDERFDLMDDRFDVMDKRFNVVDDRFDSMNERFDSTDLKLEVVVDAHTEYDRRIIRLERKTV